MIDFFHEGSNIGFSISGWSGFLLLVYILIEFSFFIVTKTFLIHKFFLGLRVRNQIKKMLPDWWYIQELSYFTINKMRGEYEVYVRVRSKISTGGNDWITTNDWIKVNWLGKIKIESLMANILIADNSHQSQIKKWSRDNTLEKLGI
jgi:hypothetical protein